MWFLSLVLLVVFTLCVEAQEKSGLVVNPYSYKAKKTFWHEKATTLVVDADGNQQGKEYGGSRDPFFVSDTVRMLNGEGWLTLNVSDNNTQVKTMPTDTSDLAVFLDWRGSGLRGTLTYDLDSIEAGKIHVKSVDTSGNIQTGDSGMVQILGISR